jgi:CheY-like chemotaxis protein
MAKLLLVDPDRGAAGILERALVDAGHQVSVADSGSFALTMLEWDRHDLVLGTVDLGDMEGLELCSIVKSDPATRNVLFVLLVPGADRSIGLTAIERGVDMLLGGDASLRTMVTRVGNLLRVHAAPEGATAAAPVARPPSTPAERVKGTLEGSLAVMDLPELTQAIALGRKTGVLALSLPAGPGVVVFTTGRVVHAEFRGQAGERAFAALIAASQEGGTFRFSPLARGDMPATPTTIHKSVEQLLLGVAADLDEAGATPPTRPAAEVAPAPLEER